MCQRQKPDSVFGATALKTAFPNGTALCTKSTRDLGIGFHYFKGSLCLQAGGGLYVFVLNLILNIQV